MEMAKDLIIEGKKDRIYEVAEKVGYGSNSQYLNLNMPGFSYGAGNLQRLARKKK